MASIRTARALAAVAALLPDCRALRRGRRGGQRLFANDGSNAAVATIGGSGVGGDNSGNSSTTQQQALGAGASNQNTSAQVSNSAFVPIDQSDHSVAVNFTPFFW